MVGFRCILVMKKKTVSYGIAHICVNLVRNIRRIWHNYGMFILLIIIIGLTFVIIFNFHRFKSFFLSLFIWFYFTKKWSLFSPFLFRSFSWLRHSFLSFLMGLFVKGLCELCRVLLLLGERISLFFFYHCLPKCLQSRV